MIDKTKLTKAVKDKYSFENETFKHVAKNNPKDRIEVEVGDSKQPDFKPQFKVMRWDNEVNFSMRAQEHPNATVETEGEKIKYRTPNYEVHQYDKPEASEDGGFEFEWFLPKKPKSNILQATISTKNIEFLYQAPLNEEFPVGTNDDGRIVATASETETRDASGNIICQRAEEFVGSYAIYRVFSNPLNYSNGYDYKAGKVGHIHRPKAIDASGNEVWCKLQIDTNTGILSVTVPEDFLKDATYPVIVDPTIGYTKVGSANFETTSDTFYAPTVGTGTLAISATVSAISFYGYCESSSLGMKFAIYDSSGNLQTPQSSELTISDTTPQWRTQTFSGPSLSSGTRYYPAAFFDWSSSTVSIHIYRDTGGASGVSKFQITTYPTFPDPATFSDSTSRYSIYANLDGNGTHIGAIETFGSTIGLNSGITDFLQLNRFTAETTGTLASMSIYIDTDNTTKVKMALYDSSRNLIASTQEINPTTGWNTATFSSPPSVTSGTEYCLAIWCDGSSGSNTLTTYVESYDYQNDLYNTYDYSSLSGVFPSSLGTPASQWNRKLSIYATYTAGGSATPTLMLMGMGT